MLANKDNLSLKFSIHRFGQYCLFPDQIQNKEPPKLPQMTTKEDLLILNEISDIITQKLYRIIPFKKLDIAIRKQKEKTELLSSQRDSRAVYAMVMLQTLFYLRNDGIDSADDAVTIQNANEEAAKQFRDQVQAVASKLYLDYIHTLPEYLLPMDSSDEHLALLQMGLDGDRESQFILSELFSELGQKDAAEFWAQEALLDSTENSSMIESPNASEIVEAEVDFVSPETVKSTSEQTQLVDQSKQPIANQVDQDLGQSTTSSSDKDSYVNVASLKGLESIPSTASTHDEEVPDIARNEFSEKELTKTEKELLIDVEANISADISMESLGTPIPIEVPEKIELTVPQETELVPESVEKVPEKPLEELEVENDIEQPTEKRELEVQPKPSETAVIQSKSDFARQVSFHTFVSLGFVFRFLAMMFEFLHLQTHKVSQICEKKAIELKEKND